MKFFTGITFLAFICTRFFVVSCDRDKPTGMKQGIYCECCSAAVKEISKKLEKKSSDPWEVKVVEAMENICKASSFRTYDYSPPTTVKGCRFLLENYDEDIEQVFIKKESDPEKKICYEISKACEGVDRTKKEKEDMDVRVNNEKQEVKQDDGIQRLNVDINDPNSASKLAEQIKQQIAMQQAEGGTTDYDDDEEEDGDEAMPEDMEEEEEDGNEGNEKSVKKPKTDEEKEGKKAEKEDKPEEKEEKASTNQKTEL